MTIFPVAEIFSTDGSSRDEAVSARIVQFDEQSSIGHTGNVAFELRSDAIAKKLVGQPVKGLALRFHSAPFGCRDGGSDLSQCGNVNIRRQSVRAQSQGPDQAAMDDQIRIAPNGRGEVGISAQVEAEMSVIFDGVFGLRLGAEHHFVDELLDIATFNGRGYG